MFLQFYRKTNWKEKVYTLNDCVTDVDVFFFVHFFASFVGKNREVVQQPPHPLGLLPLVASHEKTKLVSSASCSKKRVLL